MVEVRSKSIDLDNTWDIAHTNPGQAIRDIVLYLKLQEARSSLGRAIKEEK